MAKKTAKRQRRPVVKKVRVRRPSKREEIATFIAESGRDAATADLRQRRTVKVFELNTLDERLIELRAEISIINRRRTELQAEIEGHSRVIAKR